MPPSGILKSVWIVRPHVEQELLVLERDYNNMKANYAMLLDKRLHTRVQENVEKRQKGGKFRILDHASFPRTPVVPNKLKVLVLGFLFGCVSGSRTFYIA